MTGAVHYGNADAINTTRVTEATPLPIKTVPNAPGAAGNTPVQIYTGGTAIGAAAAGVTADVSALTVSLGTYSFQYRATASAWRADPFINLIKRVASSAANGNPDFVKASAGTVIGWWGVNAVASPRYLQVYNKASAPVLGTDTPVATYPIPASLEFEVMLPSGGAWLGTGVAFAFTTDAAGTTGAAAGDITSFALLGA